MGSAGSVPDCRMSFAWRSCLASTTICCGICCRKRVPLPMQRKASQGEPVRKVSRGSQCLDMKSRRRRSQTLWRCASWPDCSHRFGRLGRKRQAHLTEALAGGAGVVVLLDGCLCRLRLSPTAFNQAAWSTSKKRVL